jgi:hypothetical protein
MTAQHIDAASTLDNNNGVRKYFESVYGLTATHCCACGRSLRDAVSVEHMIGPICRGKLYANHHTITQAQREDALGQVVTSGKFPEVIKTFVADNISDGRVMCNIMVAFASVHCKDDPEAVLEASKVIRMLGYENLAKALEDNFTPMGLTTNESDSNWVDFKLSSKFSRDYWFRRGILRNVPGIRDIRKDNRTRTLIRYELPLSEVGTLLTWLGTQPRLVGEWVAGLTGLVQVKAPAVPAPTVKGFNLQAPTGIQGEAHIIEHVHGEKVKGPVMHVYTVFDRNYLYNLKSAITYRQCRWIAAKKCWEVALKHRPLLERVLLDSYTGGCTVYYHHHSQIAAA